MTVIDSSLRNEILNSLKKRNASEIGVHCHIIKSHNKLTESNFTLKQEINDLKLENQRLIQENVELRKSSGTGMPSTTFSVDKYQLFEEKLSKAKDQVIDLQKSLFEKAQQVISLNETLKEKNDSLSLKEAKILELENKFEALKKTNQDLEKKMAEYEEKIKLWKDEKVESELQYNCLLQKFNKIKEEYQQILTASLRFREEQIEKVNKLNELEAERIQHRLKEELLKAQTDFTHINLNDNLMTIGPSNQNMKMSSYNIPLVNRAVYKFDCNEGEVNAIKYHRNGKYFATGGGDRKIKLWELKDGKADSIGNLIGSNASVASIDIDSENNLIAGTSFDFACRLWSLNDHRLRMSSGDVQPTHTLTGHTNKVLSGKFLGVMKVVTGSYDRTLKVWDLMQKACIKTLFAGSSCNDLVTLDSQSIISGHLDKKIRFWDIRMDPPQSEICLQGKITSLDISSNRNYLLASTRDESCLKMIDIRMNQVTETFCCEEYKPAYDWARAIFSPDIDHQFVCAGSADGSLIIWNSISTKVEKVLKEHNASIISLAWHPQGHHLVTCDAKKKAVIWACK
uniref:Autophagy-related protein 16 n=1 Tax=Brachionus rotundiformis TaxID=96890 RepID=A0A2Z4EUH1_9BILA|nr:autophagy-related protein 16 [Brachionus rotundiformis]